MQATLDGEVAYRDTELVIVSTPTNYDPGIHFFDTHLQRPISHMDQDPAALCIDVIDF